LNPLHRNKRSTAQTYLTEVSNSKFISNNLSLVDSAFDVS